MKATLLRDILPRYENPHGALLPTLHTIQHEYGWIPHQAMLEVAAFLNMAPSQVIDTASFYEEYWLRPKGRHLISVCRSLACEFCGQPELTEAIKKKLGIDVGETTDDGEFTLVEVECLGACDAAPVALIDETLHERLGPDNFLAKIDEARAHSGHH
jgi:NADH-quinone oxidoreductase subunit E